MRFFFSFLFVVLVFGAFASEEKQNAIQTIREQLSREKGVIPKRIIGREKEIAADFLRLNDSGEFSDATAKKLAVRKATWKQQTWLGAELPRIFQKLSDMAYLVRSGRVHDPAQLRRYYKALTFYCSQETQRPDIGRFLASCFFLPEFATDIYFTLYPFWSVQDGIAPERNAAEKGLQAVAMQSFTQPKREDGFNNPYSPDQFRKERAWVGGNFGYRPLFATAAALSDERLFDVIWAVVERSSDIVSYNTQDTAFWYEGFCADGSGWGHGRQSYVFGYVADAMTRVLRLLACFKGTPWYRELSQEHWERIAGYLEAAVWHQYRGQPGLSINGRHNMVGIRNMEGMRIVRMINLALPHNPPPAVRARLEKLAEEMTKTGDAGIYGVRYFWNNDDLIVRRKEYNLLVNMISSRTLGPECIPSCNGARNYCLADGSMLIQRRGDEYDRAKGAMDFSLPPGVTGRSFRFPKINIWSGFASLSDFAGGIGGETGCAGFVFERAPRKEIKDPHFYGIRANKSYFMFKDIMVALGTGIRNRTPEIEGEIVTMLNQCEARGEVLRSGKSWVIHDGIGYYLFPQYSANILELKIENRKTEWNVLDERNARIRELPAEVRIFSLALRHGRVPQPADHRDSYGYAVLPTAPGEAEMKRFAARPPVRIISNTTALQAVRHDGESEAQMIFFSPNGRYDDGIWKIRVDRPAILSVRQSADRELEVRAADPLQTPRAVVLTVQINDRKIRLRFPQQPFCGKAVSARLR